MDWGFLIDTVEWFVLQNPMLISVSDTLLVCASA